MRSLDEARVKWTFRGSWWLGLAVEENRQCDVKGRASSCSVKSYPPAEPGGCGQLPNMPAAASLSDQLTPQTLHISCKANSSRNQMPFSPPRLVSFSSVMFFHCLRRTFSCLLVCSRLLSSSFLAFALVKVHPISDIPGCLHIVARSGSSLCVLLYLFIHSGWSSVLAALSAAVSNVKLSSCCTELSPSRICSSNSWTHF